uniref:Uncharacterized protein n=1 Tax=Anguilla anguilla TaxID=7936 RepID=A0A0E9WNP6_ANGAN
MHGNTASCKCHGIRGLPALILIHGNFQLDADIKKLLFFSDVSNKCTRNSVYNYTFLCSQ